MAGFDAKTNGANSRPLIEYLGPNAQPATQQEEKLELVFEDVVSRVFPLRANPNRLRSFCDRYLNMDIPPEIARFRPAAPVVLVMFVNYGSMSGTASDLAISQNEILFSVPLVGEWIERGKKVADFTLVTPFIFVDNVVSIANGREILGWPKVPVWLEPGLSSWTIDPRQRRRLLNVKMRTLPELRQGARTRPQELLAVEQEAPQAFGQLPPNLEYLLSPLVRLPQAVAAGLSSIPDFVSLARGSAAPQALGSMLNQVFRSLIKGGGPVGNTVNPKQFRSSISGRACYQSLVSAKMRVTRFNAGGLLGNEEMMRGDPTGGFSLLLHRLQSFPIIESLGLQVHREFERGGMRVAELKPLLPVWGSFDLGYEDSSRICWRATKTQDHGGWNVGSPPPRPPLQHETERHVEAMPEAPSAHVSRTLPPFNNTLGSVATTPEGPFDFKGATIRVLPIPAYSDRLAKALPELGGWDLHPSLGSAEDLFFYPVPRHRQHQAEKKPDTFVFLVVSSFGKMSAEQNDIGWWADHEVSFAVAVRTARQIDGRDVSPHFLYWPYMFSDAPMAVTEGREVLGLPTTLAKINHGADPWLDLEGPSANRRVLELDAFDFEGSAGGDMRLLEIDHDWRSGPRRPGMRSALETLQSNAAFAAGLRLPNLSLKEFRDEETPTQPCYQSLVVFERSLHGLQSATSSEPLGAAAAQVPLPSPGEFAPTESDPDDLPDSFESPSKGMGGPSATQQAQPTPGPQLQSLDGKYEVRIHRSMSFPIAESLGLHVDRTLDNETGRPIDVCTAVEPFWVHADMRAEKPIDISFRSVDGVWAQHPFEQWYARLETLTNLQSGPPDRSVSFSVPQSPSGDPRRNLEELVTSLAPPGSVYYGAADDPENLLGMYKGDGFSLEISWQGDDEQTLQASIDGGEPAALINRHGEYYTQHGAHLRFPDEDGPAGNVVLEQGSKSWMAERVKKKAGAKKSAKEKGRKAKAQS